MKRTLVIAVDRDDDFGVKGKVETPVIGMENCIAAATALGIADPEDSDLNALYAGISTCSELRKEDGIQAEIALICGDEKVGYKSDLELVAELERVLDETKPDNVILIGDGAEDEYIYPIISSRAHVDSVRKVYVKQAPTVESSFYVLTKMLSEPNKRKRFIAPIGALILFLSLFMLVPDLAIFFTTNDVSYLPSISRDLVVTVIGVSLLLYAYSFTSRWTSFSAFVKERILSRGTRLVMTSVALGIAIISAIVCYYQVVDTFYTSWLVAVTSYLSMMCWPIVIAIMVYVFGVMMDDAQEQSIICISNLFDCFNLASLGLVVMGLLDIVQTILTPGGDGMIGVLEVLIGVVISVVASYIKKLYRPTAEPE